MERGVNRPSATSVCRRGRGVTVFVGKDLEEEQKEKEKGIFRLTLDKWSVFAYNEDNLGNVMREKREKEAKKCPQT